jgi:DNA-binding SARP family transcriptional activator
MRVHVRAGRHPEAVRVYRRLREMLSIVLCLAPSRETEDLRAEVYADAPDGAARAAPGRSTS